MSHEILLTLLAASLLIACDCVTEQRCEGGRCTESTVCGGRRNEGGFAVDEHGERLDHRCGPDYEGTSCGPNRCCSAAAWCGDGDAWCGDGNGYAGQFDGPKTLRPSYHGNWQITGSHTASSRDCTSNFDSRVRMTGEAVDRGSFYTMKLVGAVGGDPELRAKLSDRRLEASGEDSVGGLSIQHALVLDALSDDNSSARGTYEATVSDGQRSCTRQYRIEGVKLQR